MSVEEAAMQLKKLPGWELLSGPDRIPRTWVVRNFKAGIAFFQKVTEVPESQGHHPDLHLVGYKYVSIEIWTHAINGLSENDFILAAKIDQNVRGPALLYHGLEQAQHHRGQRVVPFGDPIIGAVAGEQELHQVVGTDRHEVDPGKEGRELKEKRRHLEHGADSDAFGQ